MTPLEFVQARRRDAIAASLAEPDAVLSRWLLIDARFCEEAIDQARKAGQVDTYGLRAMAKMFGADHPDYSPEWTFVEGYAS